MSRSDVLVSTDWAQSNLDTESIVFVEVDEDTSAYDTGHIPGAIKLDWKTDLQDPIKRDFVDAQQFSKLLSERGIANDDTVVLYGGNNNWFAAYAYWYFKLYGHDKIKLLDGGRKKWELDGRTMSADPVNRPATSYAAEAPDTSILAYRDEVIAAIGNKNLVDVRSPDEFSGKILAPAHLPQEQSQRPGHIPGAINVPWSRAANEDGTFKSDEELTAIYAAAVVAEATGQLLAAPPRSRLGAGLLLARRMQSLLRETRETVEAEVSAAFKQEKKRLGDTADEDWIKTEEGRLKALTEARVLATRQHLAGIVAERAADVLRARHGVTALQFPGLAAESGRLAALLDDASLLRILDGAARLRLFLERNVKEDIALEAGCLALARS